MKTTLLSLLLSCCLFSSSASAEVPWGSIPGLSGVELDAKLKDQAVAQMKTENCYHECPDTVYACVTKAAPAKTALRMAGIIVRLLADGKSSAEISTELKSRAKSAHPFKKATLDTAGMPRLGPEGAKVTVVVFADFDCPYCRVVSPRLRKIRDALGDDVSYVFKLFPVKAHGAQAVVTSKAGWAAHLQGRFWEFHDLMYANFDDHDDDDIRSFGVKAGCEAAAFSNDWAAPSTKEKIRGLKREGVKLGVKSTPSVFINGKRYHGLKTEAELRDRLEEELDLVGR